MLRQQSLYFQRAHGKIVSVFIETPGIKIAYLMVSDDQWPKLW
jgi:hypothetical protein